MFFPRFVQLLTTAALSLALASCRISSSEASVRPLSATAQAFKAQLTSFTSMRFFLMNPECESGCTRLERRSIFGGMFRRDFAVTLRSDRTVVVDVDLQRYLWTNNQLTKHYVANPPVQPATYSGTWTSLIGPLFDALRSPNTAWVAEAPPSDPNGFANGNDYAHPVLTWPSGLDVYLAFEPVNGVARVSEIFVLRGEDIAGRLRIVKYTYNPTFPPLAYSPYAPLQKIPFPDVCHGFACTN
jgi:hypothetical protein